MTKITIYVARHGKTLMNTLDKVQGWCDSPLTKEGEKVAKQLGLGLKEEGVNFRTAYTSDLNRTKQTARIILEAMNQKGIPTIEKAGFKEACFGSFEAGCNHKMWSDAAKALNYQNIEQMEEAMTRKELEYPLVLDEIAKMDTMNLAESYKQVVERTQKSLKEVAEAEYKQGAGNILIIAHGVSIAGMLLSLGGDKLKTTPLLNASICKVEYENGKFTVLSMGDMSYVEKGKTSSTSR